MPRILGVKVDVGTYRGTEEQLLRNKNKYEDQLGVRKIPYHLHLCLAAL